jgi:hypothetical protein
MAFALPTAQTTTDGARRRLGTSLAQQDSNSNFVTRQSNQLAQPELQNYATPGLQPPASGTGSGGYSLDPNDPSSQPPRADDSQPQTQQAMTNPLQVAVPPAGQVVAQFPPQQTSTAQPATAPATQQSGGAGYDLATQLVQKMFNLAQPDSAGAKEIAKEGLISQQEQLLEQLTQSAASRGTSGGWLADQEAEIRSQLGPNMTAAFRGIDLQDSDRYMQNLMAALGGAQGLAGLDLDRDQMSLNRELGLGDLSLRGELGRGQLGIAQQGLGIQQEDLGLRRAQTEQNAQTQFLQILLGLL